MTSSERPVYTLPDTIDLSAPITLARQLEEWGSLWVHLRQLKKRKEKNCFDTLWICYNALNVTVVLVNMKDTLGDIYEYFAKMYFPIFLMLFKGFRVSFQ